MLSKNEAKIIALLRENPFLTQQELASQLGINRSTVATVISKMIDKGHLLGRAYIINESSKVVCIGAMNLDRKYQLTGDMIPGTSNPVVSSVSLGGVARNIAENLGRLNQSVSLLSLAGVDQDYDLIRLRTEPFVNLSHVRQLEDKNTSSYTALLDTKGNMQIGLADMAICDQMTPAWLSNFNNFLSRSDMLVADLNLPKDTVQALLKFAKRQKIDLVLIPVSGPKMDRMPKDLTGLKWLIVNQDETETYFDCRIWTEEDMEEAAQNWLQTGVEHVLITRGAKSSYYASQDGQAFWVAIPPVDQLVDVTGAGDSFSAGLIYGLLEGHDAQTAIKYGLCNAHKTIQTKETVRLDLSPDHLEREYKSLFSTKS